MIKRKALTKKLRFEIFKRDSFTCQYCGEKAPDVLLEIDHIIPVSKGGTNDIFNLTTSCKSCNAGKSNRELGNTAVIDKQRAQLEELQKRKEQIEMMFQWQKGLSELDDKVIERLHEYWSELVSGFSLNEHGIKNLKKLKKKFGIDEIISAMKIATEQYLEFENGNATHKSVEQAWKKIGGICNIRSNEKEKPYLQRLYYIRGILRNRLHYFNQQLAFQLLLEAIQANASLDSLEKHAKSVKNWSQWKQDIERFIAKQEDDSNDGDIVEL